MPQGPCAPLEGSGVWLSAILLPHWSAAVPGGGTAAEEDNKGSRDADGRAAGGGVPVSVLLSAQARRPPASPAPDEV